MAIITFGVRTPLRVVRVKIDDSSTVAQVKAEVAKDIGVEASKQTISLTPGGDAPLPDNTKLDALGINGKLVYCVLAKGIDIVPSSSSSSSSAASAAAAPASNGAGAAAAAAPSSPTPARERKLTPKCEHGPKGACQYCLPPSDEDFEKRKNEPLNKAVTFNTKAAELSKASVGQEAGDMEWLCRHRADQMCLNCAPLKKGEKVELEMLCQHAPDARCINCLPPDSTVDNRKFFSYGEYLERLRANCSHSFSATCVSCAPPAEPRYKLKSGCVKHQPWPKGICLECAPETVEFGEQKYRHVDSILVNCAAELGNIINLVSANEKSNLQRAALLFGRYALDPNFRHGTQAIIEAIYEPPQTVDFSTGAVRLLSDPNAANVEAVAKACGLVAVGWLFTRKPTRESKGAELLPHELYAIAAQQLQHYPRAVDGKPGSQFITLTVFKDPKDKQYHLQGYMATDQMMALVRDGVVQQPKPEDTKFKKRELRKDSSGLALPGEMPVPDILSKSKDRGAFRTDNFAPEFGILTMEATAPVPGSATTIAYPPIFKHIGAFPVENREAFGIRQTPSAIKKLLTDFSREPMQQRLSEFHALVYLAALTDVHTAVSAANSVAAGKTLEEGVTVLLEAVTS